MTDITYNPKAFLFSNQKVDVTAEATSWIDIKPVNVIDRNTDYIEFAVPKNYKAFWDLKRSYLEIEAKLVKADGSAFVIGDNVGVINNLGQTLFRTLECTINQHQFGSSPNLHHLRSYMENLLGSSAQAQNSYLQSELWFKDTPLRFHITDPVNGANDGLRRRLYVTQQSAVFKMASAIHHDIFNQDRYLLSGTDIGLKYYKSSDRFTIMWGGDVQELPRIEIVSANLKMCQVYLSENVTNYIENKLKISPAVYPIYDTSMQKFSIQAQNASFIVDNMYPTKRIPELIVIGFSKAANLQGNYTKSPLEFFHENVTHIGLYLDSVPIPQRPMKLSFPTRQATDGYMSLFTQLNTYNSSQPCCITYQEFVESYTLYAFNLSKSASDTSGGSISEGRQGVVRVEVQFNPAPAETLEMIVMGKIPAQILFDSSRHIQMK